MPRPSITHHRRRGGLRNRKGKGNRRSRPRGRMLSKGQTAKIIETIEFNDLLPNTDYASVFSLGQFARASTIAPNFKWYKAAYVEYQYEPLYNFYREDPTVPQPTIPYMYSRMNRTQNSQVQNLADLQAMGAKPIKFTNKVVKKYKPNWCSPGLLTGAPLQGNVLQSGLYQNGLKEEWGWLMCPTATTTTNVGQLSTPIEPDNLALNGMTQSLMLPINTNQVVYNGHNVYFEQNSAITGATICKVVATVHWHFKEPSNYNGVSVSRPMIPVSLDPPAGSQPQ